MCIPSTNHTRTHCRNKRGGATGCTNRPILSLRHSAPESDLYHEMLTFKASQASSFNVVNDDNLIDNDSDWEIVPEGEYYDGGGGAMKLPPTPHSIILTTSRTAATHMSYPPRDLTSCTSPGRQTKERATMVGFEFGGMWTCNTVIMR